MSIKDLIAQVRTGMSAKLAERATHQKVIEDTRAACAARPEAEREPTDAEAEAVIEARAAKVTIDAEVEVMKARIAELEAEQAADEAADKLARELTPGVAPVTQRDGPVSRLEVNEKRTYGADNDPKGMQFLRDVAASHLGNGGASMRLERHMQEEIVERSAAGIPLVERASQVGGFQDRATGTAAFSGLVVPQYLVDMVAPNAKAGRPLADAMRHHDLPPQGMTVNISKITTGSSTAVQAAQGDAVSETDMDDTLLTINIQTNSGQQTVSRQAIERGAGIEDSTLEDLFRSHGTTLDSTLVNQATTGLTNVATNIAYTDASPTAAELYPKLLQAPSAVEAALLDMDPGDAIAIMHSRRWYWLQSQLTSTWPLFGQPGAGAIEQVAGQNFGQKYGSGFRGLLPSGAPVIVDNNIGTALGAGTEDEVYFGAQSEMHLWEDPTAPFLIRAEQTKAANLQLLLVVYSYFAYTFTRRAHAQKISGTGLIAPTF